MAKTNGTRQAEFRARMREEGKRALHIWVTPEQAAKVHTVINPVEAVLSAALPVKKSASKRATFDVRLPLIPTKAPASIVRELKAAEALRKKKLSQIDKLQKDADGIENWYRQTVAACKNI